MKIPLVSHWCLSWAHHFLIIISVTLKIWLVMLMIINHNLSVQSYTLFLQGLKTAHLRHLNCFIKIAQNQTSVIATLSPLPSLKKEFKLMRLL